MSADIPRKIKVVSVDPEQLSRLVEKGLDGMLVLLSPDRRQVAGFVLAAQEAKQGGHGAAHLLWVSKDLPGSFPVPHGGNNVLYYPPGSPDGSGGGIPKILPIPANRHRFVDILKAAIPSSGGAAAHL